jgi:hypothetical protein
MNKDFTNNGIYFPALLGDVSWGVKQNPKMYTSHSYPYNTTECKFI